MTADRTKPKLLGTDPMIGLVASRLEGSVRTQLGRQTADIGITALPAAVLRPLLMHVVDGTIDGVPAQIMASPRLIEILVAMILPGTNIADLSPQTRALALEAALAAPLDALEARLGGTVTLQAVSDSREPATMLLAPNVGVRISLDGAPSVLLPAHIPDVSLKKFLAFQAGVEPGDSTLDPEVSLAVRIGRTASTAGEVSSLTENDILLLDETLLDDNRVCLVVDETLAALGELDGRTLKLDGPVAPMDQTWLQRFSAGVSSDRVRRPSNGSNGHEQPVVIVVDLAYRMARVSELLRIDAADPVPLPQSIDGVVELRVNRRRFATGRLARVGNAIGVRIVRIDQNVRP